jgi:hypothetical protein
MVQREFSHVQEPGRDETRGTQRSPKKARPQEKQVRGSRRWLRPSWCRSAFHKGLRWAVILASGIHAHIPSAAPRHFRC